MYFDISKANNYYQLSGKNPDDLKIGVRDSVDLDLSKKNPADFVLYLYNFFVSSIFSIFFSALFFVLSVSPSSKESSKYKSSSISHDIFFLFIFIYCFPLDIIDI